MAILDTIKRIQEQDKEGVTPVTPQQTQATEKHLLNNSVTPVTPQEMQGVTEKLLLNNTVTPVTPVTPQKRNTQIGKLTHWQVETIKKWLVDIGEPATEHHLVFNKCRVNPEAAEYFLRLANECATEKRRQKVLAMLAENPAAQRTFLTDSETDPNNVIVALAIRHVGTCEMTIPRDRYDPFQMLTIFEKSGIQ